MSNHAKLARNPGITAQAVWRLLQLLQQQHLKPAGEINSLRGSLFLLFFYFNRRNIMFANIQSKAAKIEFVQLLREFNPKSFLVWGEWFRATAPLYAVEEHEACFMFLIRGKLWFSVEDHVPEDFDEEQEFLVQLWRGGSGYTACRQEAEGWVGLL